MSIGERIQYKRKELNLTQKKLSIMTGIPITTISDYEKNKYEPNATNILKISNAIECTISWLICGKIENTEISTIELDIISMFGTLDERDKEDIIDILKMKYEKTRKRGKVSSQSEHIEENKNGSDIA